MKSRKKIQETDKPTMAFSEEQRLFWVRYRPALWPAPAATAGDALE
jgi:hypothetical protein